MPTEPLLGEIQLFGFNFAPRGWAKCQGQFLPIDQNQALFSILGTTYGGDGRTTFALPDLRGRIPVGAGQGAGGRALSNYVLGQKGGVELNSLITGSTFPVEIGERNTTKVSNASGRSVGQQAAVYRAELLHCHYRSISEPVMIIYNAAGIK